MDEKIVEDCLFCKPNSPVFTYPLFETANFRVAAHQYPILEGHIILSPKSHFSCIGELPDPIFNEFELLYGKLMDFLRRNYGSAASFERARFDRVNFHSQFHFVPADICLAQILPEGENHAASFDWLNQLQQAFQEDSGYLFLGIDGKKWLIDPALSSSQFFRDRMGTAVGKSERADWQKMAADAGLVREANKDIESLLARWTMARPDIPGIFPAASIV